MSKLHITARALPLAVALSLASGAQAGQWPVFDHIRLTPTGIPSTIEVLSEDGKTWSKVRSASLPLSGIVDIKLKKGDLSTFSIVQGGEEIVGDSLPNAKKSFKKELSFTGHTKNLGIAAIAAVSACNAKLKTGDEIHTDQFAGTTTDLTLQARAWNNQSFGAQMEREGFGEFPLTVKCIGVPAQVAPQPNAGADDLAVKFAVKSAKLGIHKPQSNVCPNTAQINARFETNVKGKVTFIYRQAGGGKSKPITVSSKKMPNGKFMAVHNQVVEIKKAMDTKYMVEVVGAGVISDWASLTVPCKIGLGGGGNMATPPEVPMKALSAQLGIQGPKTKLCPNTAKMTAWIRTNKAGKIGFRIMRKDGPVGPMVFATAVKSPAGYMATYGKTINIVGPVNQSYSVVVPGSGGIASNFVPLKASCNIKLPPGQLGG